jgi:hypothetical protein
VKKQSPRRRSVKDDFAAAKIMPFVWLDFNAVAIQHKRAHAAARSSKADRVAVF